MVHFGDAASSTETTVRLGSSSYTGRVPIPQAKPENSFSNVSRRWPSYWSMVRGRTSSIHSELIPTTAKQQLPFHLPFLELTYMSVVSGTPGAGLNPGGMRGNRPLIKLVFQIKEESKV